jgi:hypothetical protein
MYNDDFLILPSLVNPLLDFALLWAKEKVKAPGMDGN